MEKKLNAIEQAMKGKTLKTRTRAEIEADLVETIQWAETTGRELPFTVKRGRPFASKPAVELESLTVRFPAEVAKLVRAAAKRQGITVSEFLRAAAVMATQPKAARER